MQRSNGPVADPTTNSKAFANLLVSKLEGVLKEGKDIWFKCEPIRESQNEEKRAEQEQKTRQRLKQVSCSLHFSIYVIG